MGVLCSTVDKDASDPSEGKAQVHHYSSSEPRRFLRKMPQHGRPITRSHPKLRASFAARREFETPEAYLKAREELRLAERAQAFDHEAITASSALEKQADELVKKIRAYDREKAYRKPYDAVGRALGRRSEGEHFLGSVDLINTTELMRVAREMPKGAHLHVHFNSCLPPDFLLKQARNIDAMYIRSTLPLTSPQDWKDCRISFMVMTKEEATHVKDKEGFETKVPLGDIFNKNYLPNRWMSYKKFQQKFRFEDEKGRVFTDTKGAEEWLARKMEISEEEAHSTHQTGRGIWERFNYRTQMMKGLFAYESAFRAYTKACIKNFVEDNIQYAEIRPNFMSTNSLKTDDGHESIGNDGIMKIIEEQIHETMEELRESGEYFGGMKVIYCTPRSFHSDQIEVALDECIQLKLKYKDLLCGFDLVGHEEMGNELRHFIPEFLDFQKKCKARNLEIPFLFHCGETLQVGGKVDGNLYDAVLLNAKRIGHGYAIASHPLLMEIFKEKNIAIESCPISNEILGLTPVIAGHNLPILLANDVPCTINSDNGTFYKSTLSHDFYQTMIGSESMTLLGWKQLALWSLEHSCMDPNQRREVTAEWSRRWREYCQWIVEEFNWLKNWEPSLSRH